MFAWPPAPRVMARAVRAVKANRLEPGMPFGTDAVLLGDLALEEMDLRAVGSQRGKLVRIQASPCRPATARGHCRRGRRRLPRLPHEPATSPKRAATRCPRSHRVDDGLAKVGERQLAEPGRAGSPAPVRRAAKHRWWFIASPPRTRRPRAAAIPADGGCRGPRSSTSAMKRRIGPPVLTLS